MTPPRGTSLRDLIDFARRGRTNDECWIWPKCLTPAGYGRFGHPTKLAHRVVYELMVGPIPEGLNILHSCDNPPCINYLQHLHPGTDADNKREMVQRERQARGERFPQHKLTADDIRDIRAADEPQAVLAARYGVNQSQISRARSGQRWLWAGGVVVPGRDERRRGSRRYSLDALEGKEDR